MSKMSKKENKRKFMIAGMVLMGSYLTASYLAKKSRESDGMDDDNPYLNHDPGRSKRKSGCYETYIKPALDKGLSFVGLIVLAPVYAVISAAVYLDDPGPVLFTQKRVGKGGHFFELHKFRTMKMDTPHDVPTHLLKDPDQYITRVGRMLRKMSLDELPQIWDIFRGKMSIIGPRPALWNQADLIAEREKYGANSVMPGLTGLAQISGRDELEIAEKAALDGEYVEKLRSGGIKGFLFDLKCFFGTIKSVAGSDGVVEGGTGEMRQRDNGLRPGGSSRKNNLRPDRSCEIPPVNPADAGFEDYGYKKRFQIEKEAGKTVLITGAGSYVGESFRAYALQYYPGLTIDTVDMTDDSWRGKSFQGYDCVFHVAGIAHADVGKVSEEEKQRYYAVNTDLAIETAEKAKADGVMQFILMSSMIVYGDSAPYGKEQVIDAYTPPAPTNFYGDSKWQADKRVRKLQDEGFHVAVIRAPMIYGKGSKGNYPVLSRMARSLPVFPKVENRRSMLYIENLCEFVSMLVMSGEGGIYFPQNKEYSCTSELVREIGATAGKKVRLARWMKPAVIVGSKMPGKIGRLADKAFGSCVYEQGISEYEGLEYRKVLLKESVVRTEDTGKEKSILIVTSVASMIDQFIIPEIRMLIRMGYNVDVATNFICGSTCTVEKIRKLIQFLDDLGVDCYHVDFDRKITDVKANIKAFWQMGAVVTGRAKIVNHIRHHNVSLQTHQKYAFIHSHSPIGGVVGRIVGKRYGIKNIYTAHGFHFYDGAPIKNWMIFYPIEKELSRITDVLITINTEDFERAKKKFHAKNTEYIPGIGVNVGLFQNENIDREEKRKEFGLGKADIMLLSVGELNKNKNHEVIIRALEKIEYDLSCHLHYFVAGVGELHNELVRQAEESDVNLHLLGFRNDIPEILKAADIFILPSIREGLNVGLMEAMASGLPCIVSDIRGNRDLIQNNKGGYMVNADNSDEWAKRIIESINNKDILAFGEQNKISIEAFSEKVVTKLLKHVYEGGITS